MKGGAATRPEPLNPHHAPPPDRYCDMVLKGGVVDGVVYPWAIMELARAYRFKNISGTSVGAVAAALTAAAEYSRRFGSVAGFNQVLLKVPEELAESVGKDTRLYSLFQPSNRGGQRLFTLFVALFGKGKKLRGLREAYGYAALLGVVLGAGFALAVGALLDWHCAGWLHCGVLGLGSVVQLLADGLLAAVVLTLVVLACDLLALAKDGFGLCSGKRVDPSPRGRVAFTDWLHEGIQGAAGRPLDQPLTFQHLWDAPGGAGAASAPHARPTRPTRKPRSIDLRMISTSLTHGRPYGLPLPDDSPQLFFLLDEWRDYFPDEVIKYLELHVPLFVPKDGDPVCDGFRELPRGNLPVLVATRMSLSFPVLFKAVPLYAIHNEKPPRGPVMRRCWFADGGICSNFMIHQFDAVVPNWPTFGIALESARDPRKLVPEPGIAWTSAARAAKAKLAAKAAEDATSASVVVTQFHDEGREEVWNLFDPGPGIPWDGPRLPNLQLLTGFVCSLLDAAKDWNDNTSMRMSGTRDRIARIKLGGGSDSPMGGLNLRLAGKDIMKMAREYGWVAGQKLVDKFAPERAAADPGALPSPGWNEHRWVRFQSFVFGLRERIGGFEAAAEQSGYCQPLSQQIEAAGKEPPLQGPGARALTPTQVHALQATHAALVNLEESFSEIRTVQPYKPVPPPEMRLRMPL